MNIEELNNLLEPQGLAVTLIKNQETSQEFEWNYCKNELNDKNLVEAYFKEIENCEIHGSPIFTEFCCRNSLLFEQLLKQVNDKVVLEIGSSWAPQIPLLNCRLKICIEPMANRIEAHVNELYSKEIFSKMLTYSVYGDNYIPELKGIVDGLIYIRNCIDHSPNWVFILSNIATYAKEGCVLMIWNDIHRNAKLIDSGHYNLTPNKEDFIRLIENFGFSIDRKFDFHDRGINNIGIVATKKSTSSCGLTMEYTISEKNGREISLKSA
jgi:hypothetical protein